MTRFLFIIVIISIVILFCQRFLIWLKIFHLKKKLEKNPLIGIKESDDIYSYRHGQYIINYKIEEPLSGTKKVEWISLKRRQGFFERRLFNINRDIGDFFIYQRWFILFRPLVIIVLMSSLIIFYFGIKESSLRRIERFKWVGAQITGVTPESIEYTGTGWFKVSGQRRTSLDRKTEPVTISFNLLGWLFSDAANINRWSEKANGYISYPVTLNDKGDVWLKKEGSRIHGKALGNEIIWDEPQGERKVPRHDIIVENGKLKIVDQ